MADPHNQSQSLPNMLHSVTTKLAWRKVNYGPSPCFSAGIAVILHRFCSCCHYANTDRLHLTHAASSYSYSHFLYFPFHAACSCMIHGQRVCWGVWCAISGIIKLTINDFCSQTNTCVTQRAAVSDVVHISYVWRPYGSLLTVSLNHLQIRSVHVLLSHPISLTKFNVNAKRHDPHMKAQAHSHPRTVNMAYTHSSLNPSILFFFPFFHILCVLPPYVSHFSAQPPAQSVCLP